MPLPAPSTCTDFNIPQSGNFDKYKARNKITAMLRESKRRYFEKLNPKKLKEFWKYVNKQGSTILSLTNGVGQKATSGTEKANMLNVFQCFNLFLLSKEDEQSYLSDYRCPAHLLCSEDTVLDFLLSLDLLRQVVQTVFLPKCWKTQPQCVTKIFNHQLDKCHLDGNALLLFLFLRHLTLCKIAITIDRFHFYPS